ncbi:hypothetical protein ACQEU5_25020 [Marinactinospora thermotolerans]|uniref:hypothetical protein n=1 Tax=Marinactinospora thermotolerans TaxID=531310 RepID=UPI003D927D8F
MDTLHTRCPHDGDEEPADSPSSGRATDWPEPAARLLEASARLAAHPGRLPAEATPAALLEALAGLRPAQEHIERAALAVLGAARAHEVAWPRIGAATGLTSSGARDLYTRLLRRHPDYRPPLAPTLAAHTARAADLLAPVLAERPVSPFLAAQAVERLGAVLATADWAQADAAAVAEWLADDALGAPRRFLEHHHSPQAAAARQTLADHALDPAPVRAAVVELMRGAASGARPAAPTAPDLLPAGPRGMDPPRTAPAAPGAATAATAPGPVGEDWGGLAAAVLPSAPDLAAALGRLLAAAAPHITNGDLAAAKHQRPYKALYHLRGVVRSGLIDRIGTALDDVVAINPDRVPVSKYPQIAEALHGLRDTYDNR